MRLTRHSVFLCALVGVAAPRLAGANDHSVHREALRARLAGLADAREQRGHLQTFLANVPRNPLIQALDLSSHVYADPTRGVALLTAGHRVLELYAGNQLRVVEPGAVRVATVDDLATFGITRAEHLDVLESAATKLLHRQLRTTAALQPGPQELLAEVKERHRVAVNALGERLSHRDLALLRAHHKEVTLALDPTRHLELHPADDSGEGLAIDSTGELVKMSATAVRPVRVSDLRTSELGDPDQFQTLVHQRLVQVAGIAGSHTEPATVEAARQALEAERADIKAISRWMIQPTEHPDIDLLRRAYVELGAVHFPIAKFDGEELVFGPKSLQPHSTFFNLREFPHALVVHTFDGDRYQIATLKDLFRMKLHRSAAFDDAVGKALSEVPLDKLPTH